MLYPFEFKNKTKEEFADYVDEVLPVKRRNIIDAIDRISEIYPYLEKENIEKIVLECCRQLRRAFILGKIIQIRNLARNLHLSARMKYLGTFYGYLPEIRSLTKIPKAKRKKKEQNE